VRQPAAVRIVPTEQSDPVGLAAELRGTSVLDAVIGGHMSEYEYEPLEESPEVAAAVEDDTTVPQLINQGPPDDDTPEFRAPLTDDRDAAPGDGTATGQQGT
jgi:hypothetical protein